MLHDIQNHPAKCVRTFTTVLHAVHVDLGTALYTENNSLNYLKNIYSTWLMLVLQNCLTLNHT